VADHQEKVGFLENRAVSVTSSIIIVADGDPDCSIATIWPPWMGNRMAKIDEIKAEIESLPSEEVAEIFRWLSEKDWESWDKEIDADSQSGKLDFLLREAQEEKAKGNLKDL
jgi:hypothetical protein